MFLSSKSYGLKNLGSFHYRKTCFLFNQQKEHSSNHTSLRTKSSKLTKQIAHLSSALNISQTIFFLSVFEAQAFPKNWIQHFSTTMISEPWLDMLFSLLRIVLVCSKSCVQQCWVFWTSELRPNTWRKHLKLTARDSLKVGEMEVWGKHASFSAKEHRILLNPLKNNSAVVDLKVKDQLWWVSTWWWPYIPKT